MTASRQDAAGPEVPEELADVQRLVLKGYYATVGLHLGLTVREAVGAREFLGRLSEQGGARGTVTRAEEWHETMGVCLSAGVTFEGLRALGVPEAELATFPAEFRAGAAARAAVVGDEGPSRPAAWLPWLRGATGGELHLLLTLIATDPAEIAAAERDLARWWGPALQEIGRISTAALPVPGETPTAPPDTACDGPRPSASPPRRDMLVHFGYRDGFSQPTVRGLPQIGLVDPLEQVSVGALVLGHDLPGIDRRGRSYSYPVPGSPALGRNGSFAAFRILEQDVHAFEEYLQAQETATGLSAELLAAKLCGRWRDGSPLVLRPVATEPPVHEDSLNDFDYTGGGSHGSVSDPTGERCPLGAHIRRMNPRGTPVAGAPTVGRHRRLVRRGMPYGPVYEPGSPRDDTPRGLAGLFIGASLRDSFEFLMQEWANDGAFSAALGRTQDPLLGAHDRDGTATFALPGCGTEAVEGLPRFVTTRGGAYLFLPSAGALRSLAASRPDNPAAAVPFVALLPPASARAASGAAARREDPSWSLLLQWFTTRRGALLRQLLQDGPVLRTAAAVVVSGYDEVCEVLEHPEVFGVRPYATAMQQINEGAPFVLGMDAGPDFERDRALLERVLPAGDAQLVRDQVRAEAPALLAVPGPVDVVRFAKGLAVRVVAERFGLRGLGPDVLTARCHEVFLGLFVNLDQDPRIADRAQAARRFLRDHIDALVGRVRSSGPPSDDVLGRLLTEVDRRTGLTDRRVADQLIGLVVGLVDNAVAGICSAVDELLARPEVMAGAQRAAREDGDLLDRIVWEVLRFAPPAPLLVRETTQRCTFASGQGGTLAEGQLVLAVTAGAMLDPQRFADPESVRFDRPVDSYLHFGAGIHRCVGRHLGGGIVIEAVRALLDAGVAPAPEPDAGLLRRGDTPVRYIVRLRGA